MKMDRSIPVKNGHHHKEYKTGLQHTITKKHSRRRDVWGSQEKHTNMQEGVSKGGTLTDVLHESTHFDHSPDLRTPATTKGQQLSLRVKNQATTKNHKGKQQVEAKTTGKQNKGSMAKDMGTKAITSNQ
ncbi:hypothetical protein H5410_046269 [Solanum commersonii]|uniref:Uncharacterized protein n=1 Tax=Solanum commersonii TaxID=4109 RepID=A0A9J5XBT1_SOLCO|nr:hypothetical protein H5410_046269 [Solanum commersonii]